MNKRIWLVLVLITLLAATGWWYRGMLLDTNATNARAAPAAPPPMTVQLAAVEQRDVPIRLHAVGEVEALQSVAVRAEVSGVLENVAFTEGATVAAGQLLFEIDPRSYQAAVDQAAARLQRDQARLANARAQYERLAPLAKQDYVTASELADAHAEHRQAQADVAADKAELEAARIDLERTRIKAPIAGRTGTIALDAGNVVSANAQSPLVVINQVAPISIRFNVAQDALGRIRRYQREYSIRIRIDPHDVERQSIAAKLVFIDNSVDRDTGTVMLKARAANEHDRLWPGQFVSVTLELVEHQQVLVVPAIAVQPGQDGPYVFQVEQGVARVQPVEVARQQDGLAVIAAGLEVNDRVVAKVPRSLADGTRVQAASTPSTPPTPERPADAGTMD